MTAMVRKAYGDVTAAKVRAGFMIDRPDGRAERSYHYTHRETSREFNVSRLAASRNRVRFFLCEMIPTGRMMRLDEQGNVAHAWDERCILETASRVGPNELIATLRAQ